MKTISAGFRFLLNINTIWGLMILSAFVLCVIQHYQPTRTVIPDEVLIQGENSIEIRLAAKDAEAQAYRFSLTMFGDNPELNPGERFDDGTPWLIAANRQSGGVLLTWDADTHGKFVFIVNDNVVRRGSLVTLQSLTDAAFEYARIGFDIALGLVAAMVLFLGLMRVGENAGIVQLVARAFHPVMRFLFPEIPKDHPASGAILMNVTSTFLGLGNAATPFGLKAMKELQTLNPHPHVAIDSHVMLLALNTAGLALLPTSLLAMRTSAGCSDPFEIIGTCLTAGAVAMVVAVTLAKLLGRLPIFSKAAAVAEDTAEPSAGEASP